MGRSFGPTRASREKATGVPSKYAAALIAPLGLQAHGARIPDLTSYLTATNALEMEITTPAQSQQGGSLLLTSDGVRYYVENSASTDAAITYITTTSSSSATTWDGLNLAGQSVLTGYVSLDQFTAGMRIVGVGIQGEFVGSDANNQGVVTACFIPSVEVEDTDSFFFTKLSDIENTQRNYTGALKQGFSIRYCPVDATDMSFGRFGLPANSASQPSRARLASYGGKQWGTLQWHASGAAADARLRITLSVHLEIVPKGGGIALDTQFTKSDATKIEASVNAAATSNPAGPSVDGSIIDRASLAALGAGGAYVAAKLLEGAA